MANMARCQRGTLGWGGGNSRGIMICLALALLWRSDAAVSGIAATDEKQDVQSSHIGPHIVQGGMLDYGNETMPKQATHLAPPYPSPPVQVRSMVDEAYFAGGCLELFSAEDECNKRVPLTMTH